MRTAVTETSRAAYWSLVGEHKLQPMQEKILDLLCDNVPRTRKEIRDATGLELSSVCGRINSLIALGVLSVVGYCLDKKTNKRQELIGFKQPDFFMLE